MNRPRRLLVEVLEERLAPAATAADDFYSAPAGAGFTASTVLANDLGNPLSVSAVNGNPAAIGQPFTLPGGSSVTMNPDGTFVFTPNPASPVAENFTYTVTDNIDTAWATVNITYGDPPPPPPPPPTVTDPYYADYLAAVSQADQVYFDALNAAEMTRDLATDFNNAVYYAGADDHYQIYETAMAAAEQAYQFAHASVETVYDSATVQAQAALDVRMDAAETVYDAAMVIADDTWNQAKQSAAQAYDLARQTADGVYQTSLIPYQATRDTAQAYALQHPEDSAAQTAWANAEQDLANAEAQAATIRDADYANAQQVRDAAETQADVDYDAASDAALSAYNAEVDAANTNFESASAAAWDVYDPLEDAALAAYDQAEQNAWDAYQGDLLNLQSQWDAAESAADAALAQANTAAMDAWVAAEASAWDAYLFALSGMLAPTSPQARVTTPGAGAGTAPSEPNPGSGDPGDEPWGGDPLPGGGDWGGTFTPWNDPGPAVDNLFAPDANAGDWPGAPPAVQIDYWSWPGSPYFANTLAEAKYRAWLRRPAGAGNNTAVGAEVAAEFGVNATLTWVEFFTFAEWNALRASRTQTAASLDPALIARLDAEWRQSPAGTQDADSIGEEVAARWSRVPGFEWAAPDTGWYELYTYQAYVRLVALRSVDIPKVTANTWSTALDGDTFDFDGDDGAQRFYLQFTPYMNDPTQGDPYYRANHAHSDNPAQAAANRNSYADQVRSTLVPRLRYATTAELVNYLTRLTPPERSLLRVALDLEMARCSEQLASSSTSATLRRQATQSLAISQTVYSEMHYSGAAASYGLQTASRSFSDLVTNLTSDPQAMLGWEVYRGTFDQRVAFLADTNYETFVARERAAIDLSYGANPTIANIQQARQAALQAIPTALQYYVGRNMVLYTMTRYTGNTAQYLYPSVRNFIQSSNVKLGRRDFYSAARYVFDRYFRGGRAQTTPTYNSMASVEEFYTLDRFNLENMALPLVAGWRDASQSSREFFADTLHPLDRSALINSLYMAELTFTRIGSSSLATAAQQMREFLSDRFNGQMRVVDKTPDLQTIFRHASTRQRALTGFTAAQQQAFNQLPSSIRRLADSMSLDSFVAWRDANPVRVTYQPTFIWEFVDRSVLNTADLLSPVFRTAQRLAGRSVDEWGDTEAMRQIMSGNYNVRLGPTALNYGTWAVLGDAVLTVITVAPIGGVISPTRHLIVMTGATVSASFAMAAVEVAPIREEWRGPLRFAAGLAAGLRGGSVANNLTTAARTRLPLLVTRTIDLARARVALGETNALLTALSAGAPGRADLMLRQGNLTAQIRSLESQITQLRALAPVQAAETTLTTRLSELADLEARANAPGLSPAQKAARANDAAMQQARQNVRNAQQAVQEAYNAVDGAARANGTFRAFLGGNRSFSDGRIAISDVPVTLQPTPNTCVPASLDMLLEDLAPGRTGTNIQSLRIAARGMTPFDTSVFIADNLETIGFQMRRGELLDALRNGRPFIAVVDRGHAVVVQGTRELDGVRYLIARDPLEGAYLQRFVDFDARLFRDSELLAQPTYWAIPE